MITWLANIGRSMLILSAFLIIVGCTGFGIYCGYFYTAISDFTAPPQPMELVGAGLGFLLGIVLAGVYCCPLATLYDIADNVRKLVPPEEREAGAPPPPHVLHPPRTEPQIRIPSGGLVQ
jgi:hypothetical protein